MSVEERHLLNKIRFFEDMLLRSKDSILRIIRIRSWRSLLVE